MSDRRVDDEQNRAPHGETAEAHGNLRDPKPLHDRRKVLKTILVGGGVAAGTALLPGKWKKPLVEIGVLPAHAQMSGPPTTPPRLTTSGPPLTTPGPPLTTLP